MNRKLVDKSQNEVYYLPARRDLVIFISNGIVTTQMNPATI
jgi:hypothetical protein